MWVYVLARKETPDIQRAYAKTRCNINRGGKGPHRASRFLEAPSDVQTNWRSSIATENVLKKAARRLEIQLEHVRAALKPAYMKRKVTWRANQLRAELTAGDPMLIPGNGGSWFRKIPHRTILAGGHLRI